MDFLEDDKKTSHLENKSWWKGGSFTFTDSLRQTAAALSQHFNLKIEIRPWEAAVAHTNMKDKTITIGTKGIYTYGSDYYVGLLLHEIAHVLYTPDQDDEAMKPIKKFKNPIIGYQMYNMVEDRRIDEVQKEKYPGASVFYKSLYGQAGDEVAASLSVRPPEQYGTIQEFINQEVKMRGVQTPEEAKEIENEVKEFLLYRTAAISMMIVDNKIDADMTTGVDECDRMAELVAYELREAIDADKTNEEIVVLAINILKILDPLIPDKDYSQKKQQQAQGSGQGQGSSGGGKDGDGDKDGKGMPGGAHSHGGHDVKDMMDKMAYGKPPGRRSDPFQNQVFNQYTRADEAIRPQAEMLKRKLVQVMRDNDHQRFEGNQRRGLIQKKHLNRVAREKYRIYQKRLDKKGKKYAVAIVEDCSGSMFHGGGYTGGQPSDHAHSAVALLTRVMRGLGFPSSISIFGTWAKTVLQPRERYVVQGVNDRMETSNGMYYRAGGTELSEGITEALKQLKTIGGGRHKLLIAITDASLDDSDRRKCQMILTKEMRNKDFSPMLYFINSNSNVLGDDQYEAHINDVATDLVPECVRLMKKIIAPMQW